MLVPVASGPIAFHFRGRVRPPVFYDVSVGKPEARVIVVPRGVTITLLLLVTAAMVATIFFLSGRAMLRDRMSVAEVVSLIWRYDQGSLGNVALLASIAPALADAIFFLPWGALAFLSFDGREERRGRTYALVIGLGVAFALVLAAWQDMLPTRVTGWDDVSWNTMGCLAGATVAHLRKRVRIRFE